MLNDIMLAVVWILGMPLMAGVTSVRAGRGVMAQPLAAPRAIRATRERVLRMGYSWFC